MKASDHPEDHTRFQGQSLHRIAPPVLLPKDAAGKQGDVDPQRRFAGHGVKWEMYRGLVLSPSSSYVH